jgi:hypothetical protein
MNRLTLVVGALLVGAAGLMLGMVSQADDPQAGAAKLRIEGKIVLVWLRSDPEGSAVLESVEVRQLGDRWFLFGKGADYGDPENWQKNLPVWIALDDVAQLVEFADIDSYKKAMPSEDDLARLRGPELPQHVLMY